MITYYIEKDNKIVCYDTNLERLTNTLKFTPQYKDLEIKETERTIVDYIFTDTPEYEEKVNQIERQEILEQLNELDLKSIRAIRANDTEYIALYERQAQELRNKL